MNNSVPHPTFQESSWDIGPKERQASNVYPATDEGASQSYSERETIDYSWVSSVNEELICINISLRVHRADLRGSRVQGGDTKHDCWLGRHFILLQCISSIIDWCLQYYLLHCGSCCGWIKGMGVSGNCYGNATINETCFFRLRFWTIFKCLVRCQRQWEMLDPRTYGHYRQQTTTPPVLNDGTCSRQAICRSSRRCNTTKCVSGFYSHQVV